MSVAVNELQCLAENTEFRVQQILTSFCIAY